MHFCLLEITVLSHAPKQKGVNKMIIHPLNCLYIYFSLDLPQHQNRNYYFVRDRPFERKKNNNLPEMNPDKR